MKVELENLSDKNSRYVLAIDRSDTPHAYVEEISETIRQSRYGDEHHLRGFGYAIKCDGAYAGIMLIGEGIEWDCDPDEIKGTFFYRILGFVIDRRFRGNGIGSAAMEQAIQNVYAEYGPAPIVIECHKDNTRAMNFYMRHGFRNTHFPENEDIYFIRDVHLPLRKKIRGV